MDKFPEAFDRFEGSEDFQESYESVQELNMSFGNFQGYYPTYKQRRCLENYHYLIVEKEEEQEKTRQVTFEYDEQPNFTQHTITYKSGRTAIKYRDEKGRFIKSPYS